MSVGLPLMKSVLTTLAKSVLLPFGLSAGVEAIDVAIQKRFFGSGRIILIILKEEMKDIMKIVK